MKHKEALKRALKELVEARHNLDNGQKNGVPPEQLAALQEKVAYRETVVEALRPVTIDRDAWEPCEDCESCFNCMNHGVINTDDGQCEECIVCMIRPYSEFSPDNFCRSCGRPLTEEGWEMLGKRLRR